MSTHAPSTERSDRLLLRYRDKDTKNGITKHTALQAAEALGVSETQLVHLALAQFVARELPQYERDDGPLSNEALAAIARRVPQDQPGPLLSSLID